MNRAPPQLQLFQSFFALPKPILLKNLILSLKIKATARVMFYFIEKVSLFSDLEGLELNLEWDPNFLQSHL